MSPEPIVIIDTETNTAVDAPAAIAQEARPCENTPWVYTNMIQSADGAVEIGGTSGALGGPADLAMLLALRDAADVILVGALTVIGEGYRPPNPSSEVQRQRIERGQAPRPQIATVSGSLLIPDDIPLLSSPDFRPIILTSDTADPSRVAALSEKATVIGLPGKWVTPEAMVRTLGSLGFGRILLEGGPTLNGQFLAADAIDEWNVTIGSVLVGGSSQRIAHSTIDHPARPLRLARLWRSDNLVFCRYLRDRGA